MTYDEFRRHLGKAGFKVEDFAGLIEVRSRSISHYKQLGKVPPHYAVIAVLLGELVDQGNDVRKVLSRYGAYRAAETNVIQMDDFQRPTKSVKPTA